MGHRGHVDDLGNDDSCIVNGPDGGFTTRAGTLYENFDLAEAGIVSGLGSILSSHLGSIRSVLLRTPESALSGGGPTDDLSLIVGKGDDHIVEG